MYFSNGTAMNVNALQKMLKFGLAGYHRNSTLASNSQPILRTTKSVIVAHLHDIDTAQRHTDARTEPAARTTLV